MRFVKLAVESFKAIRKAELEFSPGLNVLYGPNDFGKSTIATAIQAALLVPPGSSEAVAYQPWYADAVPRVALTFVDDTGRYWKVTKEFGSEKSAELRQSKDGVTFTLDGKQREVEEKLRKLLGWGIPAPGGKSAPRGLPSSFLANVLLAPQTDVDSILTASLAEDVADTGRLRLNKALATLAQDPMLKKVLDVAQAEVTRHFTPTGQRTRKATSPFALASDAVKKLQRDLDELRGKLDESQGVEAAVIASQERCAAASAEAAEAAAHFESAKAAFARDGARREAQARLEASLVGLAGIDAQSSRVRKLEADWKVLEEKARGAKRNHEAAAAQLATAGKALQQAEESLRTAKSADAARERELRRVQLEKTLSEIGAKRQNLSAAIAAAKAASQAEQEKNAAIEAARSTRALLEKAERELNNAEVEAGLAKAILAYGRWRVAGIRARDAEKATERAAALRADAATNEEKVTALEADLKVREARIEKAKLPSDETVRALAAAERELKIAEAALGGGFSVAVRSRGQAVRASVDGKKELAEVEAETILEAQRSVKLAIGKTVDVEITAGAPEKRRAFETLKKKWAVDHEPLLTRLGFGNGDELAAAAREHAERRRALGVDRQQLDTLQKEITTLLGSADREEEQAKTLAVDAEELNRLKALIGDADEKILSRQFDVLGKNWEAQAETLLTSRTRTLDNERQKVTQASKAAGLADFKSAECTKRAAEAALGAADAKELDKELSALTAAEREAKSALSALSSAAGDAVQKAEAAVAEANDLIAEMENAAGAARTALDAAEVAAREAELELASVRGVLQTMDRGAAQSVLDARKRELAAFGDSRPTSESDVKAADQAAATKSAKLEEARQELHKLEGALSQVAGAAVREEVMRLEEALAIAKQQEREIEIDADAWKLLHDTVREVENEEGAHLGRALAAPLTRRFAEITRGRYETIKLDGELRTEGLAVAGVHVAEDEVIGALSVGTRDQLATLIRLTIAEQLKSAIVLDDQLVHTDRSRLEWFRRAFIKVSIDAQVIVLTCRPGDYLLESELQGDAPIRDVSGGTIRALDAERLFTRWDAPVAVSEVRTGSVPPPVSAGAGR